MIVWDLGWKALSINKSVMGVRSDVSRIGNRVHMKSTSGADPEGNGAARSMER